MKWPLQLTLIRHDVSAYNVLKEEKKNSALYQQFFQAWEVNPTSSQTVELAHLVQEELKLDSDEISYVMKYP